jgi:hypothetical protein
MTKIVVSSSWLTQVAHTLMAAQALRNTAAAVGQKIEVEKPGRNPQRALTIGYRGGGLGLPRFRCADRTRPVSRQTVLDRSSYETRRRSGSEYEKRNRFDAGAHTRRTRNRRGAREGGIGICRQARRGN